MPKIELVRRFAQQMEATRLAFAKLCGIYSRPIADRTNNQIDRGLR